MIGLTPGVDYFQPVKILSTALIIMLLVAGSFATATLSGFSGYSDANRIIIQWNTTIENGVAGFEVQQSQIRASQ